ncbi:MAG: carbon-nitrogen hydrolase family protein [Myxococcales bacterium]|nr:carbon-nitrogen hydrolase family protein [Myxococcales bacterium]
MRVAAVQFKPRRGAGAESLRALVTLAERAAADADLVVLPEMASSGYIFSEAAHVAAVAEAPDGPLFQALSPVARRARCFVVCGFPEAAGAQLFNSALVIDPDGSLAFVYRKTLLYDEDLHWATPGDSGYATFDCAGGRFGVGICMDLNDDAFVAWLASQELDAVAFPTNWVFSADSDVWSYWAWRLQGVDAALVAANTWGHEDHVRFAGRSAVLQRSSLLAAAPLEGDGVITATVERP